MVRTARAHSRPRRRPGTEVLGFELRLQRTASDDPAAGDQDLLLASFQSLLTAAHDFFSRGDEHRRLTSRTRDCRGPPGEIPGLGPRVLQHPAASRSHAGAADDRTQAG